MERTWNDAVEEIKSRLDIVDVISKYVILKKRGVNYIGLCPFHNEKTPSFIVSPQKGIFKCFGCGKGGDAVTFLMEIKNESYAETIKDLAEQFNIELPKSTKTHDANKDKKTKIYNALFDAQKFYTENLLKIPSAKTAYDYLMNRDINEETIHKYGLGYSPDTFDIPEVLKKYGNEILLEAGLIIKKNDADKYYNRFRDRLMIPIFDEKGDIVGFGSRTLKKNDDGPKYINSPDSYIYNKSRILYGFNYAKDAIKKEDSVLIMEGYFDVITAQINGVGNAVATCGTAMTPEHVKLISRYCNSRKIFLAFDTDKAGQMATQRGAEVIKEQFSNLGDIRQFSNIGSLKNYDEINSALNEDKYSCEIRVVSPPDGKDPDEYIREHGGEKYKEYVKEAPLLIDFRLNQILKQKKSSMSPTEKIKIVKEICPILNEINNQIIKNEYVKLVATSLRIDEKSLNAELSRVQTAESYDLREIKPNVKRIVTKSSNLAEKSQKNLLSLYLTSEGISNKEFLSEAIKNVKFDNKNLEIIKETIDKISFTVNNVVDLTESLYTVFAEDNEKKEIITDLIYLSETYKGLDTSEFTLALTENISMIEKFNNDKIKENLILQNQNEMQDE
ncbi:DNA primase, partial [bacterium]|nr:DNA primase [bacterium]